jgi:F-type H+-transporting ATPase subunit b
MSLRKRRRSRAVLIDWFTVAAQALNFIILVWLLKRVLYKPIMAAIDARERLVAAQLADAATKKTVADQAMEEFKNRNETFDRDRAALLVKATDEAKTQSARLLEAARGAADALQGKRRDALQREMKELRESLARRARQAFFALARRAFKDLANGSLEAQMIALFCERLRAIKKEDKDKLATAIQASTGPVSIRSAFALPRELQDTVQSVINETFQRQAPLRFEVAPELVSGIELTAQGQRIGWSIAEYLAALERAIAEVLPAAAAATPPSPPASQTTSSPPAALLAIT